MAILSRDDFIKKIQEKIGDSTSDEDIKFLEDMTDTYNDLVDKGTEKDSEDWKQKYEDNDKMWRQKYRDRFFSSSTDVDPLPEPKEPEPDPETEKAEQISVKDLFTNANNG